VGRRIRGQGGGGGATGVGALRLRQTGRVALDEDVNLRLRSWRIPASEHTRNKPVTLRDLLSHGAGLTVRGFPGYPRGEKLPTLPQILDGAPPANSPPARVDAAPGGPYRYSGGGYEIAELLIEEVTGKPFEVAMRELVLEPFGMTRSTFSGWSQGFRTYLVAYPNSGDGVVVLTNGDGGHDLINEVVRGVARVYRWPDFTSEERVAARVEPSRLDALEGT